MIISFCEGWYPAEHSVEINLKNNYSDNSEFVSRFELSENGQSVLLDYSLDGNNYTTDNNVLGSWPKQAHPMNETQIEAINKSNKIVLQKFFIIQKDPFGYGIDSVKIIIGEDGVATSVNETNDCSKNFYDVDMEKSAVNNSQALIYYKANWPKYFAVNFILGLLLAAGVLAILLRSEKN